MGQLRYGSGYAKRCAAPPAMREEGVRWPRKDAMEVVRDEGMVGATGIEPVTPPV